MHKGIKIAIGAIAALALAAGGGYYIWQATRPVPLQEEYQLYTVTRGAVSKTLAAEGTVEPENTVTIYLAAAQTVRTVHVKPGDAVQADDVLVDYDIDDITRELNRKHSEAELNLRNAELILQGIATPAEGNELLQYQSEVTSAKKTITDAQTDLQSIDSKLVQQQRRVDDALRMRNESEALLVAGLTTQSAYDNAETAYQNALEVLNDLNLQKNAREGTLTTRQTQLSDAERRLSNAQNKLKEHSTALRYAQQQNAVELAKLAIAEIADSLAKLTAQTTSPVSGSVLAVNAVEGATLPKYGMVVQLADLSNIIICAEITEYDAPQLALGQNVSIRTSGLPDDVYTGVISKIATSAVKKEKSTDDEVVVPIEITVMDADDRLKTGYSVDIEVFLAKHEDVIFVPMQALRLENEDTFVYTLQNDQAVKTPVTPGLHGDKALEIVSGLTEGDIVLLDF